MLLRHLEAATVIGPTDLSNHLSNGPKSPKSRLISASLISLVSILVGVFVATIVLVPSGNVSPTDNSMAWLLMSLVAGGLGAVTMVVRTIIRRMVVEDEVIEALDEIPHHHADLLDQIDSNVIRLIQEENN